MNTRPRSPSKGTGVLVQHFLMETARNRVPLSMIVAVPVVFVALAGGAIVDAGSLLGGESGPQAETATAGWTAGFVAAIAMYFQVRSAQAADRRLVLAGLPSHQLVAARLLSGVLLALLAAAASLVTLAISFGIDDPVRVAVATVMFAVIYLALGALIGALVRNPINGTVLILFIWLLDVVFGPVFRPADTVISRLFPTHYLSLWMMDIPSGHGGRLSDLAWAVLWTAAALITSWVAIAATSRVRRLATTRSRRRGSQFIVGLSMGLREVGRNVVLWALLVAVPGVFIALSAVTTPDEFVSLTLPEAGRDVDLRFWFPDTHPGLMAPIAIGCLAAVVGVLIAVDARSADGRLVLAGFRPLSLVLSRLALVSVLAGLVTGVSLVVALVFFRPQQLILYAVASVLVALTYALVGVLIGWLFGRVGGVFVAFLVPFLDLAIEQSPMINPQLSTVAHFLPGYGASRMLYDAALTETFDEATLLVLAIGWLVVLLAAAVALLRPATRVLPSIARGTIATR